MENQEFEGDHMTTGTSFSQLLFGDDDDEDAGLDLEQTLDCSSVFSTQKIPRMLCFGNYQNDGELLLSEVITSSDFSSPSSCNSSNSSFSSFSKSKKKRNGSGQECTESVPTAAIGSHRPPKKTKAGKPISNGHAKRTEKLGERIAALQQLVSPFGKTDTASVLHEAMGYIRFLHDQIQVLCSPYLKRLSSSPHHHDHYHHHPPGEVDGKGEGKKELRSKGLCLIPVERITTIHVANSNGADFWLPAMENNVSSTTKE